MAICNRDDGDFDEQACRSAGGTPYGEGSSATPTVREIDGELYERGTDGVWRPAPIERTLEDDLAGLVPIPTTPEAATAPPLLRDPAQVSQRYATDDFGIIWEKTNTGWKRAPDSLQERLGGASDPYAGAANARAERTMRMREVQDAQDAIQARMQAAQQARLAGAQFSVTPSMQASGGYFPGLQPDSPIVQAGLAQPFQYQPQGFNPERGANLNEQQIANDLAMIRRIAGVG